MKNDNNTVEPQERVASGDERPGSTIEGRMECTNRQKNPETNEPGTGGTGKPVDATSVLEPLPLNKRGKVDKEKAMISLFNNVRVLMERLNLRDPVEKQLDSIQEHARSFEAQVKGLVAGLGELQNAIGASSSGLEKLVTVEIPDVQGKVRDHEAHFKRSTDGLARATADIDELVGEFRGVLREDAIQNSKERMVNMDSAMRLMSFMKVNEGAGSGAAYQGLLDKVVELGEDLKTATAMIMKEIEDVSASLDPAGQQGMASSHEGPVPQRSKKELHGDS